MIKYGKIYYTTTPILNFQQENEFFQFKSNSKIFLDLLLKPYLEHKVNGVESKKWRVNFEL